MAPQPPLHPPHAFDCCEDLPPFEPSRFSSNPTFDRDFLMAAFDGDIRLLVQPEATPSLSWTSALARTRTGVKARALGRGAEGSRLAEKLGAVSDGFGMRLVHYATLGGSLPMCRYLLEHNIALSGTDYTALVLATIVGSMKCVVLLIEAGADVDGIGKETPLMIAATAGSTDILKCLVLAGADANVTDTYGRTPIEIVAHSGRREHVEILFPFTSHISNVRDWSVDGVISHVKSVLPSKEAMLSSAKSKAHKAFKNGNYLVATRIYDEAMELDPGDATLLSNRSLCWLRFGHARMALKDAQLCRMMRPGWAKACYREGTALMLLKEYEKACGAFLDGAKLEPGNIDIQEGLRYPTCPFWLHSSIVVSRDN
ncbi:unnamed protein product [Alopecurus aequalis]